jgi:hypothetical protein
MYSPRIRPDQSICQCSCVSDEYVQRFVNDKEAAQLGVSKTLLVHETACTMQSTNGHAMSRLVNGQTEKKCAEKHPCNGVPLEAHITVHDTSAIQLKVVASI